MDLLTSGSDRAPLASVLADRLPARSVAVLAALVLGAGVLAVGPVERELRAAGDVSAVDVRFVVERARRAGDGSTFGFARLEVVDPAGRPVDLVGLDLEAPGLRLGPDRGVRLGELDPAPAVVLPVRFAVPECGRLELPGVLTARLARPGYPPRAVTIGLGEAAQVALLRTCGLGS